MSAGGAMRVIAGSLKGRRLKTPTWEGLRPTSDKLRETLFNILAPQIRGARVLDGYAGSGAVGIEAVSRGASVVAFVDQDRRAQALIADNLAHCGVTEGYTIVRASIEGALSTFGAIEFDVVFFDPPYDAAAAQVQDALTKACDVLAEGGVVVLEHARKWSAPELAGRLTRSREVTSGNSVLTFYACQL